MRKSLWYLARVAKADLMRSDREREREREILASPSRATSSAREHEVARTITSRIECALGNVGGLRVTPSKSHEDLSDHEDKQTWNKDVARVRYTAVSRGSLLDMAVRAFDAHWMLESRTACYVRNRRDG